MGFSGNLTSVEFSGIPKLVKSGGFFKCKVDISGNLKLINLSGFFKFQFGVKVVSYKALLLAMEGSK